MKIPGFYEWEGLSCAARLGSVQSWQGTPLQRNKRCHLLPLGSWSMKKAPVKISPALTRSQAVPSHPWGQQAKPVCGGMGDTLPPWCHHRGAGTVGGTPMVEGLQDLSSTMVVWCLPPPQHWNGSEPWWRLGPPSLPRKVPSAAHSEELCVFWVPEAAIPTAAPHPTVWGWFRKARWARGLLPSSPAPCKPWSISKCMRCVCQVLSALHKHLPTSGNQGCLPGFAMGANAFPHHPDLTAWPSWFCTLGHGVVGIIYTQGTCSLNTGLKHRGTPEDNRLLFSALQRNLWSLMTETERKTPTRESRLLKNYPVIFGAEYY